MKISIAIALLDALFEIWFNALCCMAIFNAGAVTTAVVTADAKSFLGQFLYGQYSSD